MHNLRTRHYITGVVLIALLALGGVVAGRAAAASGAGSTPADNLAHQLNDPTYQACRAQGKAICNPSAWATQVAGNPPDQPPRPGAELISRADAIALALQSDAFGAGHPISGTARIYARLMTLPQYEALAQHGHDYATNPTRPLWAVTIYAPTGYEGRSGYVNLDAFSALIDAATDKIVNVCVGCGVLTGN